MTFFEWGSRRKLVFFLAPAIFIVSVIAVIVYYIWPEPTCFDGRMNQKEEGVDCSGPCTPCIVNPRDVVIYWARVLKTGENFYDIAALVENPNIFYVLPDLKYIFNIYNEQNVLVASREGRTFLNPGEKYLVFESGLSINNKTGGSLNAVLDLGQPDWKYLDKKPPSLSIVKKDFTNNPAPVLKASLFNKEIFPVNNVYAAVILYDESGNAMGASVTRIDRVLGERSAEAIFTWRYSFLPSPSGSEVFFRINLFGQ